MKAKSNPVFILSLKASDLVNWM